MYKKFFHWPVISLIVTSVIYALYVSKTNFTGLYNFLGDECYRAIVEVLITIVLPTLVVVLYSLVRFIIKFRKIDIDKTIEPIQSSKIKNAGYNFINDSISKISDKFSTLLTGERSKNVLWELEQLELAELEINGMTMDLINEKVKKFRRNRITSIANSLIHEKGILCSNTKYYTTETHKPSEIASLDYGFREDQLEFLKKYEPKESRRILILKTSVLIDEYENHNDALLKFIKWNNEKYDNKNTKSTILHIISYNNSIDEVFRDSEINDFFDFAISKKNKSITVFAQKEKITTLYDSEKATNKKITENYYNSYTKLINSCNKYPNKKVGEVYYSEAIKGDVELGKFINVVKENHMS
ncbi:MAG TPA: hypothetical protein PLW77_07985 [Bacteroidales bacterium]|nr:hypothetical protein [Bacteroidales bacterium]HQB22041.1 hypothetical protein [Bacteroidales bacterium]